MACLRFGAFEFNPADGELRKRGIRIHLHGQPAAILKLLLERAGNVVTREEIKVRLWPADTFIDFERGLNAAVARLRAALGESARQPRFLVTEPRRGYRFIAPEMTVGPSTSEADPPALDSAARRLMCLPFDLLEPDPQVAFLGYSLPDAVSNFLAGLPGLIVRSNRVVARLESSEKLRLLAAEADVDAVMTGTILRSGSQLRVTAQLIAVPAGTVVWTQVAQVQMGEIFALQDDLTRRIIASLVPTFQRANAEQDLTRDVPASPAAYEFHLRANHLAVQMRDLPLARDLYLQSVAIDPHYAPAWAGLARCHRILAKFRAGQDDAALAEAAFQQAFTLNPRCPGIHSEYAYHEAEQGRAANAIERLLREIRYSPNNPNHYAALVSVLRYAGLVDASVAAHDAAVQRDRGVRTSIMNTHFVMGNYEAALASSNDNVGFMDAMILEALGRPRQALAKLRKLDGLPPLMREWMKMLEHFVKGQTTQAAAYLLELNRQGVDPEGFFYRARLLARLGHQAEALATLEQSLQRGYYCASAFLVDPYLATLKSKPSYQTLIAEAVRLSNQAKAIFLQGFGPHLLNISLPSTSATIKVRLEC
jgi:DNA-binding winged helix-turn-helix (wHTH) protein/tetratricopeptide (TPR) repeat protein